jgi:hypothetical protein
MFINQERTVQQKNSSISSDHHLNKVVLSNIFMVCTEKCCLPKIPFDDIDDAIFQAIQDMKPQ